MVVVVLFFNKEQNCDNFIGVNSVRVEPAHGGAAAGYLTKASSWRLGKDTAHNIVGLEDCLQITKAWTALYISYLRVSGTLVADGSLCPTEC